MKETQKMGHFNDLGIDEKILSILTKKGFNNPTPIQHQVIPVALEGKDVIGIAQTGTGKTLSFGIPMIQKIIKDGGQGLILVPTRELAVQVEESIKQIALPLGLTCAVVIGGVSPFGQIKALKRNPNIVIATPGRLHDHIKQKAYNLSRVKIITLDEGDRMLDMGFLPQIKQILSLANKDRQTMLFSATLPKTITFLVESFMQSPIRIEVAPQGTSAENIEQEIFIIDKNSKRRLLDLILNQNKNESVLIFSRTKHGVKRLTSDIRGMNHTAAEIHSNRSQAQRQTALEGFRSGRFHVLVATDIAARGIDVKNISLVINYDLPDSSEDYVHRIGRTGRAGAEGKAISFVSQSERGDLRKIERLIRKTLPVTKVPELPPERERVEIEEPANFGRRENRFPRRKRNFGGQRSSNGQGGRNFYGRNRRRFAKKGNSTNDRNSSRQKHFVR